jgi:hypothetical protein
MRIAMFNWYSGAKVCYAFLSDVRVDQDQTEQLRKSRWFTRGWTLQELIAPEKVIFFDANWKYIGPKKLMQHTIASITGIDKMVLDSPSNITYFSVAQRMSWAADRVTTRVEDLAYCLLGIFNVNMPLLYGEGEKAFIRLQEEILRETEDYTLFAWEFDAANMDVIQDIAQHMSSSLGVLARHPSYFRTQNQVFSFPSSFGSLRSEEPLSMTNKGIRLQLPIIRRNRQAFAAILPCGYGTTKQFHTTETVYRSLQRSLHGETTESVVYLALPLTWTSKGDGSLGRARESLITINDAAFSGAQSHTIFLSKSDEPSRLGFSMLFPAPTVSMPTRLVPEQSRPNPWSISHFVPLNRGGTLVMQNNLLRLKTVFYAPLPLTSLTKFTYLHQISDDSTLKTTVELRRGGVDYIVGLQYTHAMKGFGGVLILLESRARLRFWSTRVRRYRPNENLQELARKNMGQFLADHSNVYFTFNMWNFTLCITLATTPAMIFVQGTLLGGYSTELESGIAVEEMDSNGRPTPPPPSPTLSLENYSDHHSIWSYSQTS